jgi:hypothetical protein
MGLHFLIPHCERISFSYLLRNTLLLFVLSLVWSSCQQDDLQPTIDKSKITRINASNLEEILRTGQIEDVTVTVRSTGPGYVAYARCSGFIPAGEYAGDRFRVTIEGEYSGLGLETLVTGSAEVKIQSERFNSIVSTELESFCCGEGHIQDFGTHYEFVVHGQVEHSTASIPHNHLFAGLGSTLGTMNFNVSDQTGTVTEPPPGGPPPHDPGIGLIMDIPAHPVTVDTIP